MDLTLLAQAELPCLPEGSYDPQAPGPSDAQIAAAFGDLAEVISYAYCDDLRELPDPMRLLHGLRPHLPAELRGTGYRSKRERTTYYTKDPTALEEGLRDLLGRLRLGFVTLAMMPSSTDGAAGRRTPRATRVREVLTFASGQAYVPLRLYRCGHCGELRGTLQPTDGDRVKVVTCICAGPLCLRCKRNRIRAPGSDQLDEQDGRILHMFHLGAMVPCDECR